MSGLGVALLLGLAHVAVDASSGVVLGRWTPWTEPEVLGAWFLLYNFCAFALQPLFGLLADGLDRPRLVTGLGLCLCAAALLVPGPDFLAPILLTGTGNALFHLGSGILVWRALPERAAGPGLFIGPGALGVLAGRLAGGAEDPVLWPFLLALGVALAVVFLKKPGTAVPESPARRPTGTVARVLPLLLFAILVRSFVGFQSVAPVSAEPDAIWVLALAACAGKVAGGFVADRTGWSRTAVYALGGAVIAFGAWSEDLIGVAAGVVLFQAVTAVTLSALYRLWPSRIAFCFGLNCLALFVGSLPMLLKAEIPYLKEPEMVPILTAVSAMAIWLALRRLSEPVSPSLPGLSNG
jgi:FSR family fosmidomycin resistance protein-like MFS transporter